jgi:hypothetical protein
MKHHFIVLISIILISFPGCISQQEPGETGYLLVDYYPVSPGDEYIYQVTRNNTTTEEKRLYTYCEQTEDGKLSWCMSSGKHISTGFLSEKGLELTSTDQVTFTPPIHSLCNYLKPGDFLTTSIELTTPQSSSNIMVNCAVDQLEVVTTPAGMFTDCIRFSMYFQTPGAEKPGLLRRRGWLAKGIGLVKALFYTPSGEVAEEEILMSADVGGKKFPR